MADADSINVRFVGGISMKSISYVSSKPPRKLSTFKVERGIGFRVSQEILTGRAGEFLGLARND